MGNVSSETTTLPVPATPAGDRLSGADHIEGDDRSLAAAVVAFVKAVFQAVARAGRLSMEAAGDAAEGPSRALARRGTDDALAQPRAVEDRAALERALSHKPTGPLIGGASAAAMAARVARRFGPLRFLGRRTPVWMVAALVPALHGSITWGVEELRLVTSLLVHRAKSAGTTPDPERVRRAAVQLVSGQPVDPSREPRYSLLAVMWLQRSVRSTLPMSKGVSTNDPTGLAAAAAGVDPATLV